jgi:hemolysin activation/secretion protein
MAQQVTPGHVTPSTLRPERTGPGAAILIPDMAGLAVPAGAADLTVKLRTVDIEGGFPELAAETATIIAGLEGRAVSVREIFAAASAIEAAYAKAGYVLVRLAVPPQKLSHGGALKIVVIDGFIEAVDASGVPERIRAVVAARTAGLVGRRHLKMTELEEPLLLAGDTPGTSLRSTLARGAQPGGVRLILEASHHAVSGRVGADNNLPRSLGVWSANAMLSANSVFGVGEQVYGSVASGSKLSEAFGSEAPYGVAGGGVVMPLSPNGRWSFNPEVTVSRTRPSPVLNALQTEGEMTRLSLRTAYTALRTRAQSLVFNAALDSIDEVNTAPDFATELSHDQFSAARIGATYTANAPWGMAIEASGQLSHGLGPHGLIGVRTAADIAETGVGYSRQGAELDFSKATAQVAVTQLLPADFQLGLIARAQTSFGDPLFDSEQFSLEGGQALSGFGDGTLVVDAGATLRGEIARTIRLDMASRALWLSPYVFGAIGSGRLEQPTAVEPGSITASSFGFGLRSGMKDLVRLVPDWGLSASASVEYARQQSDVPGLKEGHRVNASITVWF